MAYKDLESKISLITGASSGIGVATAKLFVDHGIRVGALSRGKEELQHAVGGLTKRGGEAIPLVVDMSFPDEMRSAIEKLVDQWGRLDIIFANADINGVWAHIDELSIQEWNNTIDVNFNGTFYTLKFSIPYLKKQGGSIIINVPPMVRLCSAKTAAPPPMPQLRLASSPWVKCSPWNWHNTRSA
jgi:NADP-dependent 3-hydroxy acid dehydrogenase YdfG